LIKHLPGGSSIAAKIAAGTKDHKRMKLRIEHHQQQLAMQWTKSHFKKQARGEGGHAQTAGGGGRPSHGGTEHHGAMWPVTAGQGASETD
jgi:hypothetical protein